MDSQYFDYLIRVGASMSEEQRHMRRYETDQNF